MYDVIVVGGSYAGMSAALQLARGWRTIAIIDAGLRRNRFTNASHGFLTQDGKSPEEIAGIAKEQLLQYPHVTWHNTTAVLAEKTEEGFTVNSIEGEVLQAKRLILATGVSDELPQIPGLAERWGKSAFHCPYCHGYELNRGELGVLAVSAVSMHQALLIPEWGPTTFFLNGAFEPDSIQLQQLQAHGVTIEKELIAEIIGDQAAVKLQDGRVIELVGLFVASRTKVSSPLAQQLGCEFLEGPLGTYIKTDEFKQTSVAGVFACGDAARATGSVTFAVADGALAGAATHRSLIFNT